MEWMAQFGIPALFMISFMGMSFFLIRAAVEFGDAYAGEYTDGATKQFEEIFLFISPGKIRLMAIGAALACFALMFVVATDFGTMVGLLRGIMAGLLAATGAFFSPSLVIRILRKRRVEKFNEQLVDALLTMSNALRAGFSISQSFDAVVKEGQNPIAQEFGLLQHQVRVGVRFEEALLNLEKRVESEDLTLMIRAIEIARTTGGNLTEVFERISETIRERIRIRGRIKSLTAQGRLQGIVVGVMPILLGLGMFIISPVMVRNFLSSPVGLIILVIVGVLELAGALLIRKIIRIDI